MLNKLALLICFVILLISGTTSVDEKVHPEYLQDGKLAAKLTCQPKEIRHFHYESTSRLWGEAGGTIRLSADLAVHCLGADIGGKYGTEGLKYLVELSNIRGIPDTNDDVGNPSENAALRRQKRGVGDFVRTTWTKVKCFFKRLFGNGCSDGNTYRDYDQTPPPYDETTFGERGPVFVESERSPESEPTPAPEVEIFNPAEFEQEYSLPFMFVQLANGSVPEVRFAFNESETNGAKPFKRHLTDVFNTYLDRVRNSVEETSPLGTHRTKYSYETTDPFPPTTAAPVPDPSDMLTVTRRMDPGDLVSLPADPKSGQMNDPKDLQVQTKQVQTFSGGEMVSSSGELELSINDITKRRRRRRGIIAGSVGADDLASNLDVKTSFNMQLKKRHKRAVEDEQKINDLEKNLNFKGEPLATRQTADSFSRNRLESLKDRFKTETSTARYVKEDDYLANTESISTMLEILELENKLELDKTPTSLTPIVRNLVNPEKIVELCISLRSNNCRTALLLLASTGGKAAEKTLIYLVQQPYIQTVALLSATCSPLVPHPSQYFVESLMKETQNELRRMVVRSALANTVSLLALKRPNKDYFESHLINLLKEKTKGCKDTELVPSLLDALSNMGVAGNTRTDLIALARACPEVQSYQSGVVQALKMALDKEDVQGFFLEVLGRQNQCYTKKVLVEVLKTTTEYLKSNKSDTWPVKGTNSIDKKLSEILHSKDIGACPKDLIVEYFKLKQDEPDIHAALVTFGALGNVTSGSYTRKRRGFWEAEACDDWTKHRRGSSRKPVDGFEAEGETYNRWSHCDSESYFGRRMANAEFTGGMFAGVQYPSDPAKYRVEAKMSGEATFLGKKFTVGQISFGLNEKTSSAYVKLLGRTLLDLKETDQNGCSADEFVYRPAEHIPLFILNVWVVEVTLGIHLGVDAALNFACPNRNTYQFSPTSRIRVGGEGMGRVLMLRGGVNLGGNFNYRIDTRLQPYPQACFTGRYGFDPMSISIETWYQFHKLLSEDNWSRRKTWSPQVLKWNVGGTGSTSWTRNFCIIPTDPEPNDPVVPSATEADLQPEENNSGNIPRPINPDKPTEDGNGGSDSNPGGGGSGNGGGSGSNPEGGGSGGGTESGDGSVPGGDSGSGGSGSNPRDEGTNGDPGTTGNPGSGSSNPGNGGSGSNPGSGGSGSGSGNGGDSGTTNPSNEGNGKNDPGTSPSSGDNPAGGSGTPNNGGKDYPTHTGSDIPSDGPLPNGGSDTKNPNNGGANPTTNNGGGTPNPNNGGNNPTPNNGGNNPTPNNRGDNPTPNNGGGTPNPNNGGDNPTPNNGGDNPNNQGANDKNPSDGTGSNPDDGAKHPNSAGSDSNGNKVPVPTVKATVATETTTDEAAVVIPDKKTDPVMIERTTIPVFVVKAPLYGQKPPKS